MSARNLGAMAVAAMAAALFGGCAAGESSEVLDQPGGGGGGGQTGVCVPGHQSECACPGGADGVQVCLPDGSGLGECECGPGTGGSGAGSGDPCGDAMCSEGEDCHNCVADCGTCAPCDIAPSCANAQIPPASLPHLAEFDVPKMEYVSPAALKQRLVVYLQQAAPEMRVLAAALDQTPAPGEHPFVTALREVFAEHAEAAAALRRQLEGAGMSSPASYRADHPEKRLAAHSVGVEPMDVEYPGGSMECGAPMLRVGIRSITVHEEDDDWANDIVYCLVQAEAATGGEIRVTPQTPNLDEGDSFTFSLESGVFWGQAEPRTPAGNLLITYDCVEADTSDGYQNLVNAIGDAASQIGDVVEGDNGWIFKTVGAIAPIVSTGLSLDGDDHLFNAQQTIPLDRQLELTSGAQWTVRRAGTHNLSDWDWELFINIWGCAEYGTL